MATCPNCRREVAYSSQHLAGGNDPGWRCNDFKPAGYFYGGVQTRTKMHGDAILASREVLEERYEELDEYLEAGQGNDPRCGCTDDCWFDSREQIEEELGRRGF